MAAGQTGVRGGVVFTLLALTSQVFGQSNINNPIIPGKFFMDSTADCNGPVREIYGQSASVIGHGAIQEQQGPQSCTLILKSQANFEHTNLKIQIQAATIRDCNVRFTMYDGDPGQGTLQGYDCHSINKPNEREYLTTGDTVSFVLERRDATNTLYDIEVFVTPLVSGDKPGPENNNGGDFGLFREKLHSDVACGIVGAVFLATILLVSLGIMLCYVRYKGINKPWQEHQLSTFRPANSIYETKSRMSEVSSGVYATNTSRSRVASEPRHRVEPTRHMARQSEDDDSVFDDGTGRREAGCFECCMTLSCKSWRTMTYMSFPLCVTFTTSDPKLSFHRRLWHGSQLRKEQGVGEQPQGH